MFSYINESKFLRFLILLVFFLLERIFADQVLSAKIKPREIKVP